MTDPRPAPLWLLDIDGVINAVLRTGLPTNWPRHDWIRLTVTAPVDRRGVLRLPIHAARPVLDFVVHVHAAGTAEVRWHSTWREVANTHLAPALGIMPLPVSDAPEWRTGESTTWWKLPAAQRAVAAGRRLIWTDDDLDFFSAYPNRVTADAIAAIAERPDTLLISPSRHEGLTRADLDAISRFLEPPEA